MVKKGDIRAKDEKEKIMFVLYDKTEYEMDIITDILEEENISYKTKRHVKEFMDCPIGKAFIMVYDICVNTNYEHLEFVKFLADKRIKERNHIKNCYNLLDIEEDETNINSWAKSIIDAIKQR